MYSLIINGTSLINQPWNTTFSPYINLFGQGWLLIPVTFIILAIFVKTRDAIVVGVLMMLSGALLSAGGLFSSFAPALPLYVVFSAVGIAVILYGVFYGGD